MSRAVVVVELDLPDDQGALMDSAIIVRDAGVPHAVGFHLAIREDAEAVLAVFNDDV